MSEGQTYKLGSPEEVMVQRQALFSFVITVMSKVVAKQIEAEDDPKAAIDEWRVALDRFAEEYPSVLKDGAIEQLMRAELKDMAGVFMSSVSGLWGEPTE
jgi:hypothetical protein